METWELFLVAVANCNTFVGRLARARTFLILRLYGSDIEFFDQTWRPDDLVRLE